MTQKIVIRQITKSFREGLKKRVENSTLESKGHFPHSIFLVPNGLKSILDIEIFFHVQDGRKEVKKSFHQFWHKNKVKLLFFWYQLRGHIHPFTQITLTKPWWLLFWSRMQKILRNAKKCHFRLILPNWLFQITNICYRYYHIILYYLQNKDLSYHVFFLWGLFGWLWGIKKAPRRIYRGAVNLILFRHCPSKIFCKCSIWNVNIQYKNDWYTLQKLTNFLLNLDLVKIQTNLSPLF